MLIIALLIAAFHVGYAVGWVKGQQAAFRLIRNVRTMRRGETLSAPYAPDAVNAERTPR